MNESGRVKVVASSLLPLFDEAVTDACEFLGIRRPEFFERAQAWLDEINSDESRVDPKTYYHQVADSRAEGWICANLWLQFSGLDIWSVVQRFENLQRAECLDFGCGTAALSFSLWRRVRRLWLCDLPNRVQDFVAWRVRRHAASNIRVLTPDRVGDVPQCQLAFALDVFEHLPDSSSVFAELDRHIAPNGFLVFNAPWASQFNIREHLPEAEADWFRAGGGAELMARRYRQVSPLAHGGVYVKSSG